MGKNRFYSRTALLAVCALALALGASLKDSLAYFTTYATARGGYKLTLGWETELEEGYKDGEKHIQVKNTGGLECYVRVKVFAPEEANVSVKGSEKWTKGAGDYWYYSDIVPAGEITEELVASIGPVDSKVIDEDFDVVVIQECAPVLYDGDGNPLPCADDAVWSQIFQREGA